MARMNRSKEFDPKSFGKKFADIGVLDSITYGDAMEDMFEVWRKVNAPEEVSTNDRY